MVTRFGSREICDVTFKALVNGQKVGNKAFKAGQPVFIIDTATTSNMEQASTTVYAQGGKGYNRLIAWEGEKTLTFTVTDALMSPLGLAVLTGAGLAEDADIKHIHVTYDVAIGNDGNGEITAEKLAAELGLPKDSTIEVCNDTELKPYATILDGNGAVVGWADDIELSGTNSTALNNIIEVASEKPLNVKSTLGAGKTIKLDFYVRMTTGATEITVAPDDFGGYFYVEADTLYRNQDGKDMAATITFPKVKIQSGFTLTMAANGDPSTFDFVMDAFPAYTYFDQTKKVVCDITIVSGAQGDTSIKHSDPVGHEEHVGFKGVKIDSNKLTNGSSSDQHIKDNNECIKSISVNGDVATLKVNMAGLQSYDSSDPSQGKAKWVGLIIETGEKTLENVTYNGTPLGAADIADATSVGAPAGAFVLWLKADVVQTTPKTITIGTVDGSKESRKVTIKIVAA